MALTEVYVDPSIAADSGTGTIGDPYGDLEYAIEQTTFDTTNGTRVNIKAGTAEVLAAELSTAMANVVTTPAWQGTIGAPVVFQGYTAVAGDGGIGEISGGGSVSIFNNTGTIGNYIQFIDLKIGNVGANIVVDLNDWCLARNCEIHTATGAGGHGWSADTNSTALDCYFHDLEGYHVLGTSPHVIRCFLKDVSGTYGFSGSSGGTIKDCIVTCTGSANGINCTNGAIVQNNSVYCAGGTGIGINLSAPRVAVELTGNLVEGFSGVGGTGINISDSTAAVNNYSGNAVYDCTTAYVESSVYFYGDSSDNETLTASPFNDAANGDFSPVNVGNVIEGALPQVIGGGLV